MESTIADLHAIIQVAMGWGDDYLHWFDIRGERYGVAKAGGLVFRTSADAVRLCDFGFRAGERFVYTYNSYADWRHTIRIEKTDQVARAPRCIGGRGACPPEGICGAEPYMDGLDAHHPAEFFLALEELRERRGLSNEDFGDAIRELLEEWAPQ